MVFWHIIFFHPLFFLGTSWHTYKPEELDKIFKRNQFLNLTLPFSDLEWRPEFRQTVAEEFRRA
jgi:hypothetical protein